MKGISMDKLQSNLLELHVVENEIAKQEEILSQREEFKKYLLLKEKHAQMEKELRDFAKDYMINNSEEFERDENGNLVSDSPLAKTTLYTSSKLELVGGTEESDKLVQKQAEVKRYIDEQKIYLAKEREFEGAKKSFVINGVKITLDKRLRIDWHKDQLSNLIEKEVNG